MDLTQFLNVNALYMPMLTAIGAVSLFPDPPQLFKDLAKMDLVRWLFVFILIVQGGAGGNLELAAVATAVLFGVMYVLDMVYPKKDGFYN